MSLKQSVQKFKCLQVLIEDISKNKGNCATTIGNLYSQIKPDTNDVGAIRRECEEMGVDFLSYIKTVFSA